MQDQRTSEAIARMDRALERIERTLGRAESVELERLRAAHDQLRRRVEGAIDEIDRLLGDGEG